jgi:hypothetical protein
VETGATILRYCFKHIGVGGEEKHKQYKVSRYFHAYPKWVAYPARSAGARSTLASTAPYLRFICGEKQFQHTPSSRAS